MTEQTSQAEFTKIAAIVLVDEAIRNDPSNERRTIVLTRDADTFYEMNGSNVTTLHYLDDGVPKIAVHSSSEADFLSRGFSTEDMAPHEVAIRDMRAGETVSMLGKPGMASGYEDGNGEGILADGFNATRIAPGDVSAETLRAPVTGGLAEAVDRFRLAGTDAERQEIASSYQAGRTPAAIAIQQTHAPIEKPLALGRLSEQAASVGSPATSTAAKGLQAAAVDATLLVKQGQGR